MRARLLKLGVQIPEPLTQRKFVSAASLFQQRATPILTPTNFKKS